MEDHTDQYVIGLDVGMHDVHLLQKAERQEELMGVRPDGFDVEADVLAEALHDFAQVHAEEGRQAGLCMHEKPAHLRDSKTRQR